MGKLHIYSKQDENSHVADGDGTVAADFPVDITWGSVIKGRTYYVRQGQSVHYTRVDCKVGAEKNGTARFDKVAEEESLIELDPRHLQAALSLRQALLAAQKSVQIEIAPKDFKLLKEQGYRLCFAKKVGTAAYNVVWQAYDDFLSNNNFSWTPQYQLFGSNVFEAAVTVRTSTNIVNIGLGEVSTLDSTGLLSDAKTGGNETSINLINEFGAIHPGVNQLATGIDGSQVSTPIYVAPSKALKGNISLQPVEKVLVWFEQNIETSTMFSDARSHEVEIDLTTVNSQVRRYEGQTWVTP